MSRDPAVIRIKPFHYIHVSDSNTNTTRVEAGPQTFTRQDHEKVLSGPDQMIMISPRHYCIIQNPVQKDSKGEPIYEPSGQVKIKHGDEEIRMYEQYPDPFPLYPGEKLFGKVSPLQVVLPNTALRLKALRDYAADDKSDKGRKAGEEWLFKGPNTYYPRVEVQVVEIVKAVIIRPTQALKLRAIKNTRDIDGIERQTGEEWLIKVPGAYLPDVDEEIKETVSAIILTEKKAIHLRANKTFTDVYKIQRKAGEEWLVTLENAEFHIPDVYETLVGEVKLTTLSKRQYCVVVDPWKNGKQFLGQKELRTGPKTFFLRPGEALEAGIQNVFILGEHEALLLRARENFADGTVARKAGDRWMVQGPMEYVPSIEVEIIEKRERMPLDENEGLYVRDLSTGRVRAVIGETYMLKPNEELWKKDLPREVEELLRKENQTLGEREKTKVITYRAPHNSAVQIYDFKEKKSRVVFGPELVLVGPDEEFTILNFSGEVPKRPGVIKALSLLLGPDFMTDVVVVETADHARLQLKLAYNWHFEVDRNNAEDATKLFSVPDFVGDSCKAIASRVRGAVAGETFDNFHKNSASIIRSAVFGKTNNKFIFSANKLVITNIDIQSVEPVDQRTRDSLQKSVQLAIEITTKSQEANARHDSTRLEQIAMGQLERQKIEDEALAEKARLDLLQLQADSAAVEAGGHAKAEAKAKAAARSIEAHANVAQAEFNAQASKIRTDAELAQLKARQTAELEHQKALNELETSKAESLANIEGEKFKALVSAIKPETIKKIAEAGPATQAKLLKGLGLKSLMITDGNSPINLFSTASGLVGGDK